MVSPQFEIKSLSHDILGALLFGTTDDKLSTIDTTGLAHDNLTPDSIHRFDSRRWAVYELKTTQGHNAEASDTIIGVKYMRALKALALKGHETHLISFVVTTRDVYAPFQLSEESLELIGKVQSIVQAVRWAALTQNISLEDDLSITMREILNNAAAIELDSDDEDPLIITKKTVQRLREKDLAQVHDNTVRKTDEYTRNACSEYISSLTSAEERKAIVRATYEKDRFEYMKSVDDVGTKTKTTSVCKFPMLNLQDVDSAPDISGDSMLSRMWRQALEIMAKEPEKFNPDKRTDSITKRDWQRVKLRLSHTDRVDLAKRGVEGKKFKGKEEILSHEAIARQSFKFNVDTSDIKKFVNEKDQMLSKGTLLTEAEIRTDKFIEESARGDATQRKILSDIRKMRETKIGAGLRLISRIVEELNVSRADATRGNEYVLKKLGRVGIWILQKTTSAGNLQHYSLLVHRSAIVWEYGLPFAIPAETGREHVIYDLYSTDVNRISQIIDIDLKAVMYIVMWAQEFETNTESLEDVTLEVWQHAAISILCSLEDREVTSRNISLARYGYMECVRGSIGPIRPGKIFVKFDRIVRSRLQAFFCQNFATAMCLMCEDEPKTLTDNIGDSATRDRWSGLISWVNLQPVRRFEAALNTCYLSVLHNRAEGDRIHGYLKIFNKIVKLEVALRGARSRLMGIDDVDKPGDLEIHEFDLSTVLTLGITIKNWIESRQGNCKDYVRSESLSALAKRTWEEYATLKSSACEMSDKKFDVENRQNRREKAMIEVLKILRVRSRRQVSRITYGRASHPD